MSQTVVDTKTETLSDGTVHTTVSYSDGSRTESWTPPAGSPEANAQTLRDKVAQALATNATYLGRANPTAAQTTAQVQALTRQMNALIRLLVVNDTNTIADA